MTPPKVFISYSHDSPSHEATVLALANRLRGEGVDAVLDQYESFPPRGWIHWMKDQIRDTQFILVVCTENYRRRWDGDEKASVGLGASYEGQTIQQLLYNERGENRRFIPVLLNDKDGQYLPLELQRYTHFSLYTESGYEKLYRLLTNQAETPMPILGEALTLRVAKSDFRHIAWNTPPRNPFFTGRSTHLEDVRRALTQAASANLTQPQAISGLGGVGKTQTAIEYAHLYRADYPAVLWSRADSRDALLSGFAVLAKLLNLSREDEPDLTVLATAVRAWLESNSGWLLVLDNVEDFALVRQFAPEGAEGHLLITTRLRATGEFAELIELRKMEPDEGTLFLLRRAKLIQKSECLEAAVESDRDLARQICAEMDGLPLALDQAGAFIEETPSSLAEYLALYRSEGSALRARRGELAPSHASVTITFSLAFAGVAAANPAAAELVRGCAFLAPDAIPEEVFTLAGEKWGNPIAELIAKRLTWIEAIKSAGRFALIHRDSAGRNLHIHRLVQEVIKDEMAVETRRRWEERVIQALNVVFPKPKFQNWSRCERLLPHARMAARLVEEIGFGTAIAARLLDASGVYLYYRMQYAEAEPLLRRALVIREQALGPEHADTADSLNNLAWLCRNQGRYAEAEPLYRRALAIREKALGPDHHHTASSLNTLAWLYHNQGRYAEAEPLYRRALAIREKALGPDHSYTANSLYYLARLYHDQGHYSHAESFYRRALVIYEEAAGPDDPYTARGLNDLAALYYEQGRLTEAEPLFRRALAIREKVPVPEHPDTAASLHGLATLYDNLGSYADAEPLYRRALVIREKALGPEHPDTITSTRKYAELLRKLGRGGEAKNLESRVKKREG
jgi:tetratricopeptide (TPR) repeat protein